MYESVPASAVEFIVSYWRADQGWYVTRRGTRFAAEFCAAYLEYELGYVAIVSHVGAAF